MPVVQNANLSLTFDLSMGIRLRSILDAAKGREYLRTPSMLFEFAANNGTPRESDTGLSVLSWEQAGDGTLTIAATALQEPLSFELRVELLPGAVAATLQLTAFTSSNSPIFLRVVFPKIFGVATPGDFQEMMGALPQEGGWVVPLASGLTLGMPFTPAARDVGLPIARNNMELASIYDRAQGGGVFFCDVDGDLDNGIAPLQFNLSATAVVAFWIGEISSAAPGRLPRLAIGVHGEGDWREAVDFYTAFHRPRWRFPETPQWFRNASAIYCPTALTGGGIYVSLPWANLPDGVVWQTWEDNGGPWRDGKPDAQGRLYDRAPVQASPAGFGPAGVLFEAAAQNAGQMDVFASGADGAVWVTWQVDGLWRNNRLGRMPARITPTDLVIPGAPLASGWQGNDQLDVFFAAKDGAIHVTWERGDTAWTDGADGRPQPAEISPKQFVKSGSHLAAAKESDHQLDLFVIRDGAIWFSSVVDYGGWDVWTRITPSNLFSDGAPLVAVKQSDNQINVFAVSKTGAIFTTWRRKGENWQKAPIAVTPEGFVPDGSYLAAAKQNDNQLDVFAVREDGAIWVAWERDDKQWQGPAQTTTPFLALPRSGVAAIARSDTHVDAFTIGTGRITSFTQLPRLLGEAHCLGTNILYLTDYWEGADEGGDPAFWNKGDYYPRADLGGEAALVAGIAAVHEIGGKVILYLEPFVAYQHSDIGKLHGAGWAGRDFNGNPYMDYPAAYSMPAPFGAWQDWVVNTALRLIGYGADGIFLDSYAWQMNRPMSCNDGGRTYTAQEYSSAVLALTDRVRTAAPGIVVLGETTAGPIARHWHGGVDADFGFGNITPGTERLIASPVRYGIREVHMFANGTDLNGLHQFYSAGHGLALSSYWSPGSFMFDWGAHIKKLVEIRSTYADALIDGAQFDQPSTGNPDVIAYQYEGMTHRMLTVVNIGQGNASVDIDLKIDDTGWYWVDLLTSDEFAAEGGVLKGVPLSVDDRGIRVMLHKRRFSERPIVPAGLVH